MKLLVTIQNQNMLNKVLSTQVDGVIIGINGLCVNTNFSCLKEEIVPLLSQEKEIYLSLNKMMHHEDLSYLKEVLTFFQDKNVKIIFYDLGVLKIAKDLGMIDKLVLGQEHLNTSWMSHQFYESLGIFNTILSSDITLKEILEMKEKTKMNVYVTSYGYIPIFHSKRKLITSYFQYIQKKKEDALYYIFDKDHLYPIIEEESGTTVYTNQPIDYLDELNILEEHKIDYLILDSIFEENISVIIEEFLKAKNKKEIQKKERYKGFLYTKTIYKVKKNEK